MGVRDPSYQGEATQGKAGETMTSFDLDFSSTAEYVVAGLLTLVIVVAIFA